MNDESLINDLKKHVNQDPDNWSHAYICELVNKLTITNDNKTGGDCESCEYDNVCLSKEPCLSCEGFNNFNPTTREGK